MNKTLELVYKSYDIEFPEITIIPACKLLFYLSLSCENGDLLLFDNAGEYTGCIENHCDKDASELTGPVQCIESFTKG
jgi:hypothetical protein